VEGIDGLAAGDPVALNNSVVMPALGFGVFQTPPDETRAAVSAALEAGPPRAGS